MWAASWWPRVTQMMRRTDGEPSRRIGSPRLWRALGRARNLQAWLIGIDPVRLIAWRWTLETSTRTENVRGLWLTRWWRDGDWRYRT